ncbi:MAG TPA: hypothetical protein V6D47_01055, partial [Oscillatoriaceae cyanobacterium]
VVDEKMQGEVRITVIATGFDAAKIAAPNVTPIQRAITPEKAASIPASLPQMPQAPQPAIPAARNGGTEDGPDIPEFLRNSMRRSF